MINFYVYRVKNGLKKWTDVPSLWQEKVKEELVAQGYVLNEDGTVERKQGAAIGTLDERRLLYK